MLHCSLPCTHINKFFNQDLNFEKHLCSAIEKKVFNHQIQIKYYRFLCYLICSDIRFDDFLFQVMALENQIFDIH